MKKNNLLFFTQSAVIAAMYVALTFVSNMTGLASGAVQVRISEALTVLPYFTPAAVPGLFIGCFTANLLTGSALWDVVFGSLATLLGAVFTYLLRRHKWLASVPPIFFNTLIIPFVIKYVYLADNLLPFLFVTVGAGELASCGVLGMLLLFALKKYERHIFGNNINKI